MTMSCMYIQKVHSPAMIVVIEFGFTSGSVTGSVTGTVVVAKEQQLNN